MTDTTDTAQLVKRLRDAYADVDHVPPYAASLAGDAADALERIAAENAELRKDAERYRWLRGYDTVLHPKVTEAFFIGDATMDKAIDAAMAEGKGDD